MGTWVAFDAVKIMTDRPSDKYTKETRICMHAIMIVLSIGEYSAANIVLDYLTLILVLYVGGHQSGQDIANNIQLLPASTSGERC